MIKNKNILTVCPARGGSKGIPLKNLVKFLGVPLVAHVGKLVSEIPQIDRAVVSSDHPEIIKIAEQSGLAAPFRRPESLSGDQISDLHVLTHALQEMERIDQKEYDIVLMLQPTSPLRTKEQVVQTLEMLVEENWDAVWTVSETDSKNHPLKQLQIQDNQLTFYHQDGPKIIARQQLAPLYHRNGAAYAITRSCLLNDHTIMGARTGALVLHEHLVSIDTMWDLQLAEFIAKQD